MKKLFTLCVCAIMGTLTIFAQDIIVTTDAKKIEAKILEVSKSAIKYKEKDNLEGPSFILETNEISSIIYANGKVVLYNAQPSNNTNTPAPMVDANMAEILLLSGITLNAKITEMKSNYIAYVIDGTPYTLPTSQIDQITFVQTGQVKKYNHYNAVDNSQSAMSAYVSNDNSNAAVITPSAKSGPCYQGYFDISGYVGKEETITIGGFGVDGIDGVRFNKYLFTGIGVGLHTMFLNYQGITVTTLQTPLFADIRVYLPTKKKGLYPYMETSIGPMFQYYQHASYKGQTASTTEFAAFAFFRLNAGIDVDHFTFGLGYELVGNKNGVDNFFFAKIGARLGRFDK